MKEKMFDHGEISGFLDEGTSFIGELSFRNTMRIDGKFKGKITSKNVLIIGETAEIEGDIDVSNVSINGKVSGTIAADKKIEIHSKGKVYCDIDTPKLVIEDGAFFQGNCNMKGGGETTIIEKPASGPDAAKDDKKDSPDKPGEDKDDAKDRLGKGLKLKE
jgi:cytoskeletal protein CcmA (bactofilin family)